MQHAPDTCVLIVDFTKWGLVDEGNVHCFVVCVLSGPGKYDGMRGSLLRVCSTWTFTANYLLHTTLHQNSIKFIWSLILDGEWKPSIQYYDFVAQSTTKKPIKQVFPYVKVLRLINENNIV